MLLRQYGTAIYLRSTLQFYQNRHRNHRLIALETCTSTERVDNRGFLGNENSSQIRLPVSNGLEVNHEEIQRFGIPDEYR